MKKNNENLFLIQKELVLRKARTDLLAFTRYIKKDYKVNWHHRVFADKLTQFALGNIQYLMIFCPPRHGKSELVSRNLPAFLHGLYPDLEIMAASYLDSLAGDMTIDIQKIIDSKEYQDIFPNTKIYPAGTRYAVGTRNSSEHHIVGRKGKYRGQGVGGSFTGKGAGIIILDDVIKGREIADSEAFRERLWNFYNNDLFSRLETNLKTGRKGQVLITLTRWHEDDIAGRLLDIAHKDTQAVQWEVVCFPAIKDSDTSEDNPRQIGEALWPAKYNLFQLDQIKASVGNRAWNSLYQQNPTPDGANLFNLDMFEEVAPPSNYDYSFITSDTAYKEKQENDYSCFCSWGVLEGKLYLRDVWMERVKSSELENHLRAFVKRFLGYGFRGTYIEPKGHGIYLNQKLSRESLMIPSEETLKEFYQDRNRDKVERANNVVPHLAYRKMYISKFIKNKDELITQLLRFPKVKHDDFADCVIDGLKMAFGRAPSIFEVL